MMGIDPDEVDYSDPSLPLALDAEAIRQGIARGLDSLGTVGHEARQL